MKISRSDDRIKTIIIGLLYWCVLIISNTWALQRHFSWAYPLNFNVVKLFVASITVVVLFLFLPQNDTIYSLYLLIALYVIILPMGSVYCCANKSTVYYLSVFVLYLLIEIFVGKIKIRRINIRLNRDRSGVSKIIIVGSILFVAASIVVLFIERGLPGFKALNFRDVYSIREAYVADSIPVTLAKISSQAFIPFLVTISLYRRKYVYTLLLFFAQFLFFLWLAHKAILFSILIMGVGFFLSKAKRRALCFSCIFTGIFALITVLEGVSGDLSNRINFEIYNMYGLIARRGIFVPAYLKQHYYSYFVVEGHSLAGLFGTIISPFLTRLQVPNPYANMSYTKVIGNLYFDGSNANTGMFGGEMAHFGYFGLLIAAICFLVILLCVKESEKICGKTFTCCISIYSIMSLSNGKAMDIICFSPLLLICIILLTFEINSIKINTPYKKRITGDGRATERLLYKQQGIINQNEDIQ